MVENTIQEKLNKYLADNNISINELAVRLGINGTTLWRIVKGKSNAAKWTDSGKKIIKFVESIG